MPWIGQRATGSGAGRRPPSGRAPPPRPAVARTTAAATRPDAAHAFMSEPPREHQDDENQEDETDSPARIGTPARAVAPRRQAPDQNEYQDDDQDQWHARSSSLSRSIVKDRRAAGDTTARPPRWLTHSPTP